MSNRSTWFGRIALVLSTLILVVAVAEGVIRIAAWQSARRARATAEAWQAAHPEMATLPQLNGVFALARKNVRGLHKGVVVRTNAIGLRGPDRPPDAERGVARIVIAGDSFVFGSGVDEGDTYPSRLGALLDARRPGTEHEVINAGLAGAHIGGVMDRLEVAIDAYRPGLYVYGFTVNDIEGPDYQLLESDARTRGWLAWSGSQPLLLIRYVTWRLLTLGSSSSPAEQSYPLELRRNYLENPAAWSRFAEGLDRFAALAREAGVCGHVLIHTHLTNLDADHPFHPVYQRVSAAARERGLSVTASFPAFDGRESTSLWINFTDSHPNSDGHALLAQALATDLAGLPPSCWDRAAGVTARDSGPP